MQWDALLSTLAYWPLWLAVLVGLLVEGRLWLDQWHARSDE